MCGCRIQEEEKFEEKEGIIVCRHCYLNGKNPKCAGCLYGIDVKYVEAGDKIWHRTCFQCSIMYRIRPERFWSKISADNDQESPELWLVGHGT
ncbi:hypothetical protein TELCIR_04283 [Teladorsagia circumcincta]|uniref:LIM zinc-binding domain-containing protein n=1 Tax=Teladorsagia circumcincta TaxID=45464 RepID=A0A2G9UU26_TELCI|nr:hypothetical protein TELCIR_04283 [Teladorsagia circumcincta]